MLISGTHFNYYQVCKRKLWLFANGIQMEQTSDLVLEGKLIHESSYPQRPERYEEVEIDGIKVDFYDTKNKVIHEIKKSNKIELAHEWQLKYYIYKLKQNGIEGVTGILEYPSLRSKSEIYLSEEDERYIDETINHIESIVVQKLCPVSKRQGICRNCSYYEFCFITEEEEK